MLGPLMGDKKQLIKPRTPPGTLELLPREQVAFQKMMDTIRSGYERFGFVPIETPTFETTEVLLTKTGGETEKQIYFVQSTGARQQGKGPDLALKFDLTVPLARYVAEHEHELTFPFRRYQIQRVYRGERPQKGRFREFYQCDIDVIGKDTLPLRYDAEMPAVIHHVFSELDIGAFTIRLNNRKLLRGVLDWLRLTDAEQQTLALREVDKLDKVGRDGVVSGLAKLGLGEPTAKRMLDTLVRRDTNAATVEALRGAGIDHALFSEGLSEIEQVLGDLAALGVPEPDVQLDPTIARGLDYYTGTVYETVLDDHPDLGSVCSGGRYEDLASLYTKSKLPGVGISIGLTRLFPQLLAAGLVHAEDSSVHVLVTQLDDGLARDYLELATELRAAGLNIELFPQASKLGKQMKHADRAGIRFAAVMGPDEKHAGTVTLKDLRSGQQESVPRDGLAGRVLELLG